MSQSNGYLGFAKRPSGRFGNQLFQYYFLARIARATNSSKFHPRFLGNELFENFGIQFKSYAACIGWPSASLSREELQELSWSELIQFANNQFNGRRKVILPTGVLDYCFYEDQPESLDTIFRSKIRYTDDEFPNGIIALHFRGSDFQRWNAEAVMNPDYYFDALDLLNEKIDLSLHRIELFTDDPSHETVQTLLSHSRINLNLEKDYKRAFIQISKSKALVSSPSTFAYWAGALGSNKIVINSTKWITSEIDKGDRFWLPVREGKCKLLKNAYEV